MIDSILRTFKQEYFHQDLFKLYYDFRDHPTDCNLEQLCKCVVKEMTDKKPTSPIYILDKDKYNKMFPSYRYTRGLYLEDDICIIKEGPISQMVLTGIHELCNSISTIKRGTSRFEREAELYEIWAYHLLKERTGIKLQEGFKHIDCFERYDLIKSLDLVKSRINKIN